MSKPITAKIAAEIGFHEAVIREAYKDSVGVWTWSVGLTNATGHNVERYIDNPQTLEKCFEVYVWALDNYAETVRDVFQGHDMTEEQFGAALSFHWNTGSITSASWCDAWKRGDMTDAERRFMMWKNPPEIIKRREAEADLLFRGQWSGDGTMTEYGVRSNYSPDWGSAKKIEVMDIFEGLFETGAEPEKPPIPEIDLELIAKFLTRLNQRVEDLEKWRKS